MSDLSAIARLSEKLPENLRRPNSNLIAAIVSVGLHGAFIATLPNLSLISNAEEPQTPDPVPLVELTQGELQRIPDFSVSEWQIPNLSFAQPVPNSSLPFPTDRLPKFQDPFNTTPPPPPLFDRSNRRQRRANIDYNELLRQYQDRQQAAASDSEDDTDDGRPIGSKPGQTRQVTQEQANANGGGTRPGSPTGTGNSGSPGNSDTQLVYNPQGVDLNAYGAAFSEWASRLRGFNWKDYEIKRLAITLDYPANACPPRPAEVAAVTALVHPEGQLMDNPAPSVVRSSGYAFFNAKALEAVRNRSFEATGRYEVYTIEVAFQDTEKNCPDVAGDTQTATRPRTPGGAPPTTPPGSPTQPSGNPAKPQDWLAQQQQKYPDLQYAPTAIALQAPLPEGITATAGATIPVLVLVNQQGEASMSLPGGAGTELGQAALDRVAQETFSAQTPPKLYQYIVQFQAPQPAPVSPEEQPQTPPAETEGEPVAPAAPLNPPSTDNSGSKDNPERPEAAGNDGSEAESRQSAAGDRPNTSADSAKPQSPESSESSPEDESAQ